VAALSSLCHRRHTRLVVSLPTLPFTIMSNVLQLLIRKHHYAAHVKYTDLSLCNRDLCSKVL